MLTAIKKIFRKEPMSEESFLEILRSGCRDVVVNPTYVGSGRKTSSVGVIGTFQYGLEISALTAAGKHVAFHKLLFERDGAERGFASMDERGVSAVRQYLLAELEANRLQAITGEPVIVIGPDDRPMDSLKFYQLHRDAEKHGISIDQ